ncbi:DUF305 domain-containing protein [Micromonospora sp. NPDC049679]|uniref:DUF305 domain-containing protein n=1 Tax=Micromonospora sp. NPDC049679 TaxID=3155920 RepID=UPI0033CF21D7
MKRSTLALAIASLPLLAGCGADPSGPGSVTPGTAAASPSRSETSPGGTFNATDVMFVQMMIAHHRQGLEIVRLARTRPAGAEVRTLAAAIEVTETDEAATMTGWLRGWGEPMTADAHAHDAHGGLHGTSAADIASLTKTTDARFERDFLHLMIAHQHAAIEFARIETGAGVNPHATDLARRIDRSRSAQITQMLALVDTRP